MNLTVGLCLFHQGVPFELLHQIASSAKTELWRVKPLFVDDQTPHDIFIRKSDHLSLLHTQKPKCQTTSTASIPADTPKKL